MRQVKKLQRKLNTDFDDDDEEYNGRNMSYHDEENQTAHNPRSPHRQGRGRGHGHGHGHGHGQGNEHVGHGHSNVPTASEFLKQKYAHGPKKDHDDVLNNNVSEKKIVSPSNGTQVRKQQLNIDEETENQEKLNAAIADAENLGENFANTPWLPPSIEKAKEFKTRKIYKGGDWRLDSIDVSNATDLGPGVTLYFQFVRTFAFAFFFMTVLSFPSLVFVYSGTRVAPKDRDIFGFYKYTLGNLGYDSSSSTYPKDSQCQSHQNSGNYTTCIHVSGNEYSLLYAAQILTALEFLQDLIFLIAVAWLSRKVYNSKLTRSSLNFSAADYSIIVTNLAADTTEIDLIKHFSNLYRLDDKDWKGRLKVEETVPVSNSENSGNPIFEGTWVAECIVHKKVGQFISSFKGKENLTKDLYLHRATMKMYSEGTSHAKGPNQKKYDKAARKMTLAGSQIDTLTEKNLVNTKLTVRDNELEDKILQATGHSNIYHNIDADAVAGFVTFEYTESLARCLKDYSRYSTFPWSLFYPEELKFKGRKIAVTKAPEPDQILWEHLEISSTSKAIVRVRTAIITILLTIGCFIVILQASINKSKFSGKIPSSALCAGTIPNLYLNNSIIISGSELTLVRPLSNNAASLDAKCNSYIPSSFYAVYSATNDPLNPVATYDFSGCTPGLTVTSGICPVIGSKNFCPCISTKSSVACKSTECYGKETSNCKRFDAGSIGACYCYKQLSNILGGYKPAEVFNQLRSQESSTTCSDFYNNYSLSTGFTYLSIGITVIVGALMRYILKVLTKHEAHTSLDNEFGSLMLKMFLSNYITMAVIVLVAYGNISGKTPALEALYIFTGPYLDFNPEWYGNVGFYLTTTFIVSSFSPLAFSLIQYLILFPLLRLYHYPQVRKLTSNSIVMQNQLNYLEVGPEFEVTEHTAQLLTFIFFAMTFSAGLPLLMPLCFLAFVVFFRVDKMLLCRFYRKPPFFGDSSLRIVVNALPYAAIIRLGFACWMFSNNEIFPYDKLMSSNTINKSPSIYDFGGRIGRPNVLPLFVLLILVIAAAIVGILWKYLPIYWAYKLFVILVRYFFKSDADIYEKRHRDEVIAKENESNDSIHPWELVKTGDPLRQQMAPYSGPYFRYLKHKDEIPNTCLEMFSYGGLTKLTEMEAEEGWVIADKGEFVVKVKGWMENHRRTDKTTALPGEWKRTYEVIADHRCCSFNIERVPAYKMAIIGLREGIHAVQDDIGNRKVSPSMKSKAFFPDEPSEFNRTENISSKGNYSPSFSVKQKPSESSRHHSGSHGTVAVSPAITPSSTSHHHILPEVGKNSRDSPHHAQLYNQDLDMRPVSPDNSDRSVENSRHMPSQYHPKSEPEKKKVPKRLPREMSELDDDFNDGIPGLV